MVLIIAGPGRSRDAADRPAARKRLKNVPSTGPNTNDDSFTCTVSDGFV